VSQYNHGTTELCKTLQTNIPGRIHLETYSYILHHLQMERISYKVSGYHSMLNCQLRYASLMPKSYVYYLFALIGRKTSHPLTLLPKRIEASLESY